MDELDERIKDALTKYCEEECSNISFEEKDKHVFSERYNQRMRELFPFLEKKDEL